MIRLLSTLLLASIGISSTACRDREATTDSPQFVRVARAEPLRTPALNPPLEASPPSRVARELISPPSRSRGLLDQKRTIVAEFAKRAVRVWGRDSKVPGLKTRFDTTAHEVALTLDACGGSVDHALIDFLRAQQIPSTLFVTGLWLDAHRDVFARVAKDPLFEIENHGLKHRPCSIAGRSAYGIRGTTSVAKAFDEIVLNAEKIESITGRAPLFYRSGTAFYDDVCVELVERLGERAVNFSVEGDAGASLSRAQVRDRLLSATAGSIVLIHANRPHSGTALGVQDAVPQMLEKGVKFVRLRDVRLQ